MAAAKETGVFPLGGDGDRWAYMRDGRVIWASSLQECERRANIARIPELLREVGPLPQVLDRAIHAV